MRLARLACLLLAGAGACPALAQDVEVWCAVDGPETLSFVGAVISLNEHTICEADSLVAAGGESDLSWSGSVACNTIHITGQAADGTALTTALPVEGVDWMALATDETGATLTLRTAPDTPGVAYLPC